MTEEIKIGPLWNAGSGKKEMGDVGLGSEPESIPSRLAGEYSL